MTRFFALLPVRDEAGIMGQCLEHMLQMVGFALRVRQG